MSNPKDKNDDKETKNDDVNNDNNNNDEKNEAIKDEDNKDSKDNEDNGDNGDNGDNEDNEDNKNNDMDNLINKIDTLNDDIQNIKCEMEYIRLNQHAFATLIMFIVGFLVGTAITYLLSRRNISVIKLYFLLLVITGITRGKRLTKLNMASRSHK